MDEARPVGGRRARHGFGPDRMHGLEPLARALEQDADQIDDHMRVARGRRDRIGVPQVRLHGMDLADAPERLQVAGEVRTPHRDADAVALPAECADHMAAEESRAAEDRDEGVDIGLRDHGAILRCIGDDCCAAGAAEYAIGPHLYRGAGA